MQSKTHLPLLALLSLALPSAGCYLTFDEGLKEVDVKGVVVIDAELAGVSDFRDLSDAQLRAFVNQLGVVYVGAWSGLAERQGVVQPTFDPFSRNAFPYAGTTIGAFAYVGLEYILDCESVTGRFYDLQNLLDHYDVRIRDDGFPVSRYLEYRDIISDGLVESDEAAELQMSSMYPRLSEVEYVESLLADEYFRFYMPPDSGGCSYDEEGNLLLETCEISDFDFVGSVPWTINADGDLEAPFTLYKVFTPENQNGETVYPKLWAWADQNGSTCNPADGQYTSVPYIDTLNFVCEYMTEGDLVSNYEPAAAPSVTADGSLVVVHISKTVAAVSAEQAVDSEGDAYDFPYCGY